MDGEERRHRWHCVAGGSGPQRFAAVVDYILQGVARFYFPDMFQEKVGLNLSVLVGKTLEAAGQVESPYCGGKAPKGSIRVVESTQWKIH